MNRLARGPARSGPARPMPPPAPAGGAARQRKSSHGTRAAAARSVPGEGHDRLPRRMCSRPVLRRTECVGVLCDSRPCVGCWRVCLHVQYEILNLLSRHSCTGERRFHFGKHQARHEHCCAPGSPGWPWWRAQLSASVPSLDTLDLSFPYQPASPRLGKARRADNNKQQQNTASLPMPR